MAPRKKAKKKVPARKTNRKKKIFKKKKQKSFLGFLFKWLFVLGLWGAIIGGGIVAWYAGELPDITKRVDFERKTSITIKAADGAEIMRYGEIRGNSVGIEDIPPHLIHAVIAIEDRRFYSHFGIDPFGLARAMAMNVQKGRLVQGGSTITQQLAKNIFLSHERTLKRKIQEAMLAIWLEQELSKDEIMSAYLNRVYLGSGIYGVDAAANLYFGKNIRDINIREAAIIAGLLKAPSRYSPHNNPDLANARAETVLKAMKEAGYLSGSESQGDIKILPKAAITASGNKSSIYRYYTDWVIDQVDDIIGTPQEDLIIETTLNPDIQNIAHNVLSADIDANRETLAVSQGAITALRHDGAVVAMVGGYDYQKSQFNRVTQAKRQPGSAFKPILYLTALRQGWDDDDIILDSPIKDDTYSPKNFGDEYYGEVELEFALMKSLNTAAVRLIHDVTPSAVIETARAMGIQSKLTNSPSLALGASEVSPLELTAAYAAIANGGYAVEPYAITRITNLAGELYYERPRRRLVKHIAPRRTINTLEDMMQRVMTDGTGKNAKPSFFSAGKTGTSQNNRDAWFAGYSDDLVTSVWLGNDDNSPMNNVTGGGLPARMWKEIMTQSRGKLERGAGTSFIKSGFESLIESLTGAPSSEDERNAYQHEQVDYNN